MITGVKEFDCAEQLKAAAEGPPRAKLPQLPFNPVDLDVGDFFDELENIPGANLLLDNDHDGVNVNGAATEPSAAAAKRKKGAAAASVCEDGGNGGGAAMIKQQQNLKIKKAKKTVKKEESNAAGGAAAAAKDRARTPNNKPKRKPSGYIMFTKETRQDILEVNPAFTFADVNKELGARWRAMAAAEKEAWKAAAVADAEAAEAAADESPVF